MRFLQECSYRSFFDLIICLIPEHNPETASDVSCSLSTGIVHDFDVLIELPLNDLR